MAIDSYMAFKKFDGTFLGGESQVEFEDKSPLGTDSFIDLKAAAGQKALFEIDDYSFDVEQTLNIGSQSTGAGAGKINFNPFSVTRKIDKASPTFFLMAAQGTTFKEVTLAMRKSSGIATGGSTFLRFDYKLVAVKSISWSHDDEAPRETIVFEYGGLQMRYSQQDPSGKMLAPTAGGWNRIKNNQDFMSTV